MLIITTISYRDVKVSLVLWGSGGGAVGMIMCCGGGSGHRGEVKLHDSTCTKLIRLKWMAYKRGKLVYHSYYSQRSQCPPEQPTEKPSL